MFVRSKSAVRCLTPFFQFVALCSSSTWLAGEVSITFLKLVCKPLCLLCAALSVAQCGTQQSSINGNP